MLKSSHLMVWCSIFWLWALVITRVMDFDSWLDVCRMVRYNVLLCLKHPLVWIEMFVLSVFISKPLVLICNWRISLMCSSYTYTIKFWWQSNRTWQFDKGSTIPPINESIYLLCVRSRIVANTYVLVPLWVKEFMPTRIQQRCR